VKIAAFLMVLFGLAMNAQAVISPTSLKVKIFEMRVSKNTDCSGAVRVFSTSSPTPVDFFSNPDFGSGVISTGTYHCVMFHISDIVSFIPEVSNYEPLCVAGTSFSYDIFESGATSVSPDGVAINGTGTSTIPSEDDPWIYLSDSPTAITTNNGCFQPTKTGTGGPCVMTPLTLLSDQAHSLVMDADLQVEDGGGTCILNPTSPLVISIR